MQFQDFSILISKGLQWGFYHILAKHFDYFRIPREFGHIFLLAYNEVFIIFQWSILIMPWLILQNGKNKNKNNCLTFRTASDRLAVKNSTYLLKQKFVNFTLYLIQLVYCISFQRLLASRKYVKKNVCVIANIFLHGTLKFFCA